MKDAIDPEWELIGLRRERGELRREVERLSSMLSVERARLSCTRKERDKARAVARKVWGEVQQWRASARAPTLIVPAPWLEDK